VKKLLDHLPSPLVPERVAERRRAEEIMAEAGWLKFEERKKGSRVTRRPIGRLSRPSADPDDATQVVPTATGAIRVGEAPRDPDVFDADLLQLEVDAAEAVRDPGPDVDFAEPIPSEGEAARSVPIQELDGPHAGLGASEVEVPSEAVILPEPFGLAESVPADTDAQRVAVDEAVPADAQPSASMMAPLMGSERPPSQAIGGVMAGEGGRPALERASIRVTDFSKLPGFREVARSARRAVREIVETEPSAVESPVQRPEHWLSDTLRRAGVPSAADLRIDAESSTEDAWRLAEQWCGMTGMEVCDHVARMFRTRSVDLASLEIERFDDVPDALMLKHRAIPLARGDRAILVAVSDPSDPELDRAFTFTTRKSIVTAVASPAAIADALWKTYGWMI
jgi:hypothetical protein